jgi:predicted nucleic-acid-binding Zn-ribbon protein
MNAYYIVCCQHCGAHHTFDNSIMVHGGRNLDIAMEELKTKKFEEVASRFCGYCGGRIPCNCGHERPQ